MGRHLVSGTLTFSFTNKIVLKTKLHRKCSANFNYFDTYGGSANGQTCYSLSEQGNYSNYSLAVTRFTESESTYANVNDTSSGISTSGIQGSYAYGFTNGYNFNGSGSGLGNYSLHEEGSYGAGSYNL